MELLELVIKTLSDKLGEQIVSIDMRSVNPFTDYFVITTAKNVRHANSLANDLMKEVEKKIYGILRKERIYVPKKEQGSIRSLIPFMSRNGYYDAGGWWIEKDD